MPSNEAHRYLEVKIKTARPTELIVILYDGAIAQLQKAQEHFTAHDISGRVSCLNRAIAILTELQANLNFEAGGEIAVSLDKLYHYLKDRIFQANVRQDPTPLIEVARLLSELRGSWASVAQAETRKAQSAGTAQNRTSTDGLALTLAADGASASADAGFNITG